MFTTLLAEHGHPWGYGPGPWIPLTFLLLWITVIAAVVWRFRRGRPPWARHTGHDAVAERFARGEITADEYRERRDVLRDEVR
jgi:putative membrane protein